MDIRDKILSVRVVRGLLMSLSRLANCPEFDIF
jgi:hypothetical protein